MSKKFANKGEWSELLAFAVIARDASVPMSDAELQPIEGSELLVEKILRLEGEFSVSDANYLYLIMADGTKKKHRKSQVRRACN